MKDELLTIPKYVGQVIEAVDTECDIVANLLHNR